jgi:glycosyltransferase involved in cell wall biosynthesis
VTLDDMIKESENINLLWANRYCLLDTSSGASISIREMLHRLTKRNFDVDVVGATVFDSEAGKYRIASDLKRLQEKEGKIIRVKDGDLSHNLVKTKKATSREITLEELNVIYSLYVATLDKNKPDVFWFYGGNSFDYLLPYEAKRRGIATIAYLANGNYSGSRWCEDVDLILTDSQATADMYTNIFGRTPTPIGKFIPPESYVAKSHTRDHVTFVNPVLAKGAAVVVQLALALEEKRPDIKFEIVESRGGWSEVLQKVSAGMGKPRNSLSNVIVTPNTDDMRPVYARSRVILAPSMWWESGGRVLAEAMLNGIPAIVTNRGGCPEMIEDAGIKSHCRINFMRNHTRKYFHEKLFSK